MKVVIIDGQGGSIGRAVTEKIKNLPCEIYAIGTNTAATSAMLKAGARYGATGENPVVVNVRDADVIVGPVGIIAADSLLGEITPRMAAAVACSRAKKVLIPQSRCKIYVAGTPDMPMTAAIDAAAKAVERLVEGKDL